MTAAGDTIVALATPRGQSALAVVRVSGPDAITIVDSVFSGASLMDAPSHSAHVGSIRAPRPGETGGLHHPAQQAPAVLDQVVVTVFRNPRSATGEDVVEVSCHGGDVASALVVDCLVGCGARPANPGEFTQRAFLNGKVDLAQAEAIGELIHARAERAHRVSVAHLYGRYSELIDAFRNELLDLVAFLELELDFSEEDVEFADRDRLQRAFREGSALLDDLLASYRYGRTLSDGIRVAIAGRPNAGKSTLLNAVLGSDRAIVSDVAGTTRDAIEAESSYDGHRLIWVDTAGLRGTSDRIEAEGVERAKRIAAEADVVVYVVDAREGLHVEEDVFLESLSSLPVIVLHNKMDLVRSGHPLETGHLPFSALEARLARRPPRVLLEAVIECAIGTGAASDEHRTVTSARHVAHLDSARKALERAATAFGIGASGDMLVSDLKDAMDHLGMITGAMTNEDVLDRIFSRFCIGK